MQSKFQGYNTNYQPDYASLDYQITTPNYKTPETDYTTNVHPSSFAFKNEPKLKLRTYSSVVDGDPVWSRPNQIYKEVSMFELNSEKNTNYALQALNYTQELSPLSLLFFSQSNIDEIQKLIRYNIYVASNNKHVIDYQSEIEIVIVMKSMFLRFAQIPANGDTAEGKLFTVQEIQRLNELVINEIVPKLISNVEQYTGYLRDSTNPYKIMATPQNTSSKGNKGRSYSDVLFGDSNFFGV